MSNHLLRLPPDVLRVHIAGNEPLMHILLGGLCRRFRTIFPKHPQSRLLLLFISMKGTVEQAEWFFPAAHLMKTRFTFPPNLDRYEYMFWTGPYSPMAKFRDSFFLSPCMLMAAAREDTKLVQWFLAIHDHDPCFMYKDTQWPDGIPIPKSSRWWPANVLAHCKTIPELQLDCTETNSIVERAVIFLYNSNIWSEDTMITFMKTRAEDTVLPIFDTDEEEVAKATFRLLQKIQDDPRRPLSKINQHNCLEITQRFMEQFERYERFKRTWIEKRIREEKEEEEEEGRIRSRPKLL